MADKIKPQVWRDLCEVARASHYRLARYFLILREGHALDGVSIRYPNSGVWPTPEEWRHSPGYETLRRMDPLGVYARA